MCNKTESYINKALEDLVDYNLEELSEFTLMNYYVQCNESINAQIRSFGPKHIGQSKAYEHAPDEEINELIHVFINNPELEKEAAIFYRIDFIKRNIQP